MDKAIVVFTNFFDADALIGAGQLPIDSMIIDLTKTKTRVYSIAVLHPDMDVYPNLQEKYPNGLSSIDIFTPTAKMLAQYEADKNKKEYAETYEMMVRKNKFKARGWFQTLKRNDVHILCGWEKTTEGFCHRKVLYDMFKRSKIAKKACDPIYRHG